MGNYIFLLLVLASFFGLSKLFTKAGLESWKAFVPIYNFYVLAKLLGKPWWWCLIMIVPGVNIIMYGVFGFNVARAFNKPSNQDLLFASILPYIFFVKLGFDDTAKFVGLDKFKIEPSKMIKNWIDPIVFAVIAASIIRGYFIEAFTIPTSSLEKSLMVGDFLFVNKFAYGPKIPQTPLAFPFAHHTMPLSETKKSYLEWIKLPYFRLPGFGTVKNENIVVFNYPDGDTVLVNMQDMSYYGIIRYFAQGMENEEIRAGRAPKPKEYYKRMAYELIQNEDAINPLNGKKMGKIYARPVDKREHYVKRCVGIAGDKFEVRDAEVFINETKQATPEKAQHNYFVKCSSHLFGEEKELPSGRITLSNETLLDKLDIYASEVGIEAYSKDTIVYNLNMPASVAQEVKEMPGVVSVTKKIIPAGTRELSIFPHNNAYAWNNDNFGPLLIPKKGLTLPIDTHNICLYEKILNTYDDGIHQVGISGAQVLYDGKPITNYTFKQDYYFMMGDNRHNSADSRSWGMVPYDHVVGSPFFVWFSMKYADNNPVSGKSVLGSLFKNSKDGKFRWERFLCYVDDGNLHSIKIPFILAVILIWGFNKWNNRRKLKLQKNQSTK
ncbi:MAG: S26 family signal peptidase [Bacteroidota bacterium]|nr:S26 family signal peptidase [Bacteroidota bacterium]MDP3147243.1 S26 family signal peptidase [Bacteroidota bacterium]